MAELLFSLRSLARDACAFLVLAGSASVIGLASNAVRPNPVPLRYVSVEDRLALEVRHAAPAAGPAPAAPAVGTRTLDLEEFQRIVSEKSALILDARAGSFYRLGHVPGALNLSREAFEKDYSALRGRLTDWKGRSVAVYCSGADCQDSKLVAEALVKLGFPNVLIYPEGWEQWTEAGLPAEPPVPPGV